MDRFKHVPRWLRRLHWEHVMNVMLLLIALSIIGTTIYQRGVDEGQRRDLLAAEARADAQDAQQAECLRDSIVDLTTALNVRLVPADIERQATRDLIDAAVKQQDVDQAIKDYQRALRKADRLRQENPVPDYPDGLCEKAGK